MARYIGSQCKRCRRHGAKLFLKGERCFTDKCAFERRKNPPGMGPIKRKNKPTDYLLQLKEKQKLKDIYGLLEKQFRLFFERANRKKGITAQNLIDLLEARLDNMVYRLGFAMSRKSARQMVRNGYFKVNNRNVKIPSYIVKIGDIIKIKDKYANNASVQNAISLSKQRGLVEWVELNEAEKAGKLLRAPMIDELNLPVNLQLVIELYSK